MRRPLIPTSVLAGLSLWAADRASLSGRVLDRSAHPVENATVFVYHAGVKTGYSIFCPSCYPDCGKKAVTSQTGNFVLKGLDPDLLFDLLVVRDGFQPTFVKRVDPLRSVVPDAVMLPRFSTPRSNTTVQGRVVDDHGVPLPGTVVEPIGVSGYELPDGTKSKAPVSVYGTTRGLEPMAVTDNKGQFELTNANPVFGMLLNVEARGFAKKFEAIPARGQRRQIAVYRGAAVRGRLVDHGVPVSGAEIGLIARDCGGFGANLKVIGHPYGEIRVGTQPDGSFLLSDVPTPVDWFVYAKMTSLPEGRSSNRLLCATRRAGEIVEVGDLSLEAGHRFRGRVVNRNESKLPDGMRLIISSNEVWDNQIVPLGSDGSFKFDRLATGTYEITPSVRGYKPVQAVRHLQIDRDVSNFQVILEPGRD